MLSISKIFKKFGPTLVLNNISFNVEFDQIFGIAGASGSGKSTLLRCIQNLETLDSGEIICDGTSGFMFQDFQLFPNMTILDNLVFAPKSAFGGTNLHQEAKELLIQLGITDKQDCRPNLLSGGQKQRVALARSLMMKPNLLLCDEPTSGLDVSSIAEVARLLKSVCNKSMAIVIASHDLEFLCNIADRILVLKSGSIIADIEPQNEEDPVRILKKLY